MNFDKFLFRASSLGHLMAEGKEKSNFQKWQDAAENYKKLNDELNSMSKFNKDGETISKNWQNKFDKLKQASELEKQLYIVKDEIVLSDGAKTHLMDIYIREKTGRKTDIENRYIKKGLQCEEDSITLYSRVKKHFFKKNETHLKNLFVMGTPDLFEGKSITEANVIPDIKTSWDVFTFYRTYGKKLNQLYFWQIIAYMWLTGARKGCVAYCLVDTPEPLIQTELNRLWYKLGQPIQESDLFKSAEKELRKNMIYSDFPLNERVLEYQVEWSDEYPTKIENYVKEGRKYLNQLHLDLTAKQS